MPDRCEQLQAENHQVKKNFNDLELQIKKIEVMLRRKSSQLYSNKIVDKNGEIAKFESDLEHLIMEDVSLQAQEQELMSKVKKLQDKRKQELADGNKLY